MGAGDGSELAETMVWLKANGYTVSATGIDNKTSARDQKVILRRLVPDPRPTIIDGGSQLPRPELQFLDDHSIIELRDQGYPQLITDSTELGSFNQAMQRINHVHGDIFDKDLLSRFKFDMGFLRGVWPIFDHPAQPFKAITLFEHALEPIAEGGVLIVEGVSTRREQLVHSFGMQFKNGCWYPKTMSLGFEVQHGIQDYFKRKHYSVNNCTVADGFDVVRLNPDYSTAFQLLMNER